MLTRLHPSVLLFVACITGPLRADDASPMDPADWRELAPLAEPDPYDGRFSVGTGGGTSLRINGYAVGDISTFETDVAVGLTLPAGDAVEIRYGLLFRNRKFNNSGRVPLIDSLHALALDLRASCVVTESISVMAGVLPGSYGQSYRFAKDFRAPVFASTGVRLSETLTLVAGARYNARGAQPLLPLGGLRWAPTPRWRAQLLFPRSSIEYDWTRRSSVFVTAAFQEAVGRIDDARLKNIDDKLDRVRDRLEALFPGVQLPPVLTDPDFDFPTLVDKEITYRDLEVGVGLARYFGESGRIAFETGVSVDRTLEFADSGLTVRTDGVPYYFRVTLSGTF